MVVDRNTELRKLRPAEVYTLALILNISDGWKKLMSSVIKEGTQDIPKFTSESITIIEQASLQDRKPPAAIFIEEWATMGRKRPSVGLLLELLIKTELFRAADYLAEDILKVAAPQRPTSGPAVPIDAEEALIEILNRQNLKSEISKDSNFCLGTKSEVRLSQINYPILETETSITDNNFVIGDSDVGIIQMQYNEMRSNQVLDHAIFAQNSNNTRAIDTSYSKKSESSDSLKELKNNEILKNNNSPGSNDSQISDLIKFSGSRKSGEFDNSENLEGYSQSDLIKFDSEKINVNESKENYNLEMCEEYLPDFNILSPNSSTKAQQSLENNEGEMKSLTSRENCSDDRNNEAGPIPEMSSRELPASLCRFVASKYFHRELMSAELPVCINDRTGFHSSETNFSKEIASAISLQSSSSNLTESNEDILKSEIMENIISARDVSCVILRDEMLDKPIDDPNEIVTKHERRNNAFNSQELPVTVLEFHKR